MIALLSITLADEQLERVRRNHGDAIAELQRLPASSTRTIRDIVLADGVATPVPHGLGRPAFVTVSPPRGISLSGRIEEVRDGAHDRNRYVVLKQTGCGANITVDIEVK